MFATSKALTSNAKSVISKLVFNGFSQCKNGQLHNLGATSGILASEESKNSINFMTKTVSFGITHAKHISEISNEIPIDANLRKIQKTATMVHCFNPQSHHEEDVPIRIMRTNYTVTFLPST